MKFIGILIASTALLAAAPAQAKPLTIAIIDTGVVENPLLSGKLIGEYTFNKSQERGVTSEHGTWVAGVIAKNAKVDVQFVSLRVDNARTCSSDLPICTVDGKARAEAVQKAADLGVDMIVMTSDGRYSPNLKNAMYNALNAGIEVVVGAGNTPGAPSYAGTIKHPNFHIVGALDTDGRKAEFSSTSRSPSMVWRLGVGVETQAIDGTTVYRDGTSYAAPLYAAEIASNLPLMKIEIAQRD